MLSALSAAVGCFFAHHAVLKHELDTHRRTTAKGTGCGAVRTNPGTAVSYNLHECCAKASSCIDYASQLRLLYMRGSSPS